MTSLEDASAPSDEILAPSVMMRTSLSRTELHDCPCTIQIGGQSSVRGRLYLSTIGATRALHIRLKVEASFDTEILQDEGVEVQIHGEGFSVPLRLVHIDSYSVTPSLFPDADPLIDVSGEAEQVDVDIDLHPGGLSGTVIGHAYNVPTYRGQVTTATAGRGWMTVSQRLPLRADGWEITIDNIAPWIFAQAGEDPYSPKQADWLNAVTVSGHAAGNLLTHVIRLRRVNGGAFGLERSSTMLSRLELFLSFVLGRSISMPYRYGYDRADEGRLTFVQIQSATGLKVLLTPATARSWSPLTAGSAPPSHPRRSDIDDTNAALVCFLEALKDDRDILVRAIEWYVGALSSKSSSACLVLAQAGLELLAYQHLSRRLKIRESSRQRMEASDQLRALMSHVGIPLGIPERLADALPSQKNMDGPEWITQGRNRAVHPGPATGKADLITGERAKLLDDLAVHYLELALLRLIGHRGFYWNRIDNVVLRVPWVE